jgi:hypothetical protein
VRLRSLWYLATSYAILITLVRAESGGDEKGTDSFKVAQEYAIRYFGSASFNESMLLI